MSPSGMLGCHWYAQPPGSESVEAHLEEVRRGEHERITYERASRTWIVVSGYNGDRIFYRKAMLACGGRPGITWHLSIQRTKSAPLINSSRAPHTR